MTPTEMTELRAWAMAHEPCGSVQARQVLALLARVAELAEWQSAVSEAIRNIPEFATGEWAGDKDGWGYHFEIVNWLCRHRAELQALTLAQAERIAVQSELLSQRAEKERSRHGECDACGYPNNPGGICSRSGCCNSD